jgi:hypothetical protein
MSITAVRKAMKMRSESRLNILSSFLYYQIICI